MKYVYISKNKRPGPKATKLFPHVCNFCKVPRLCCSMLLRICDDTHAMLHYKGDLFVSCFPGSIGSQHGPAFLWKRFRHLADSTPRRIEAIPYTHHGYSIKRVRQGDLAPFSDLMRHGHPEPVIGR
jgi:hypothetical protein